jgi:hypothetical protein
VLFRVSLQRSRKSALHCVENVIGPRIDAWALRPDSFLAQLSGAEGAKTGPPAGPVGL